MEYFVVFGRGGVLMEEPLAEKAYLILEERFIRGCYMPNEKLSENQLCKELEMSRTPIRQALGKLIGKGYITSIDKKGIFVKPISIKYAVDCRDLLMTLELAMAERLEKHDPVIDFDDLQASVHQQMIARDMNDYYSYLHHHFHFRIKLFQYANNLALTNAYKYLVKDIIRIVMIIWRKTEDKTHYSIIEKDQQFIDYLKQKDFEKIKRICCDPYTFEMDTLKSGMYKNFLVDPDFVE